MVLKRRKFFELIRSGEGSHGQKTTSTKKGSSSLSLPDSHGSATKKRKAPDDKPTTARAQKRHRVRSSATAIFPKLNIKQEPEASDAVPGDDDDEYAPSPPQSVADDIPPPKRRPDAATKSWTCTSTNVFGQPCEHSFSRTADLERHLIFVHLGIRVTCHYKTHRIPARLSRPDSIPRHMCGGSLGCMGAAKYKALRARTARKLGVRSDSTLCTRDILRQYAQIQMPCYAQARVEAVVELLPMRRSLTLLEKWLSQFGKVVRCGCDQCGDRHSSGQHYETEDDDEQIVDSKLNQGGRRKNKKLNTVALDAADKLPPESEEEEEEEIATLLTPGADSTPTPAPHTPLVAPRAFAVEDRQSLVAQSVPKAKEDPGPGDTVAAAETEHGELRVKAEADEDNHGLGVKMEEEEDTIAIEHNGHRLEEDADDSIVSTESKAGERVEVGAYGHGSDEPSEWQPLAASGDPSSECIGAQYGDYCNCLMHFSGDHDVHW